MTALIIVDPQYDFGNPAGALYVPKGEELVKVINDLRLSLRPKDIVITQDYHPQDHVSFVTNNPGTKVFSQITLPDGTMQTMWPPHCVQGSSGAEFLPGLYVMPTDFIVRKGMNKTVDSYSAFGSPDGVKENTQLDKELKKWGIKNVVVCGLAFDYCVSYTARDAAKFGYNVCVVRSACRGISPSTCADEELLMKAAGVKIVDNVDQVKFD